MRLAIAVALLLPLRLAADDSTPPSSLSCTSFEVRDACCPAGCAAKNGRQWSRADEILRACMRGLGCESDETEGASVFIACDCHK